MFDMQLRIADAWRVSMAYIFMCASKCTPCISHSLWTTHLACVLCLHVYGRLIYVYQPLPDMCATFNLPVQ